MTNNSQIERLIEVMDNYVPEKDVTKKLAENIANVEYGDLPSSLVSNAKATLLNTIGQMISGASAKSSRKTINYIRAIGGKPAATCIYYGDRTNIFNAALANGAFCFGLELPNLSKLVFSFGSSVIPAALAVAESEIANGHELITSIALGLEVTLRLAQAVPDLPSKRPLNPISTFGPFGAAVAAGKILRMDSFEIENALSCCPAQAAGTMQSSFTGGESARLIAGFAASYGLRAASMARRGISGARGMLEGKAGFLMCIAGLNNDGTPKFDVSKVNEGFGEKWNLLNSSSETPEDSRAIFEGLTQTAIPQERICTIFEIVNNFEEEDDVTRLLSKLVVEGG